MVENKKQVIAETRAPVWSRGVFRTGSEYVCADMKGQVLCCDLESGAVSDGPSYSDAVSADLAVFSLDSRKVAVGVDHGGRLIGFGDGDEIVGQLDLGAKVRAGLGVISNPDGVPLLVLVTAEPALTVIDPSDGWSVRARLRFAEFPVHASQGVVAAPLVFNQGGAAKAFVCTRRWVAYQVDLATGRIEASLRLPYGCDSDPCMHEDLGLIYFTSGESTDGVVTGVLHAYDPVRRRLAWTAPLRGGADTPPLLLDWQGKAAVVTATIKDASIYVFDAADGQLLNRTRIPETPYCRHDHDQCRPVGYGAYHTQTAVCKFYAKPWAELSNDGNAEVRAVWAACHNGNVYRLSTDGDLRSVTMPGSMRAGPVFDGEGGVLLHAGTKLMRLLPAEGTVFSGDRHVPTKTVTAGSFSYSDRAAYGQLPYFVSKYLLKQAAKLVRVKVYY
jgi:hypothetical protein